MQIEIIVDGARFVPQSRREKALVRNFIENIDSDRRIISNQRRVLKAVINGFETAKKIAAECHISNRSASRHLLVLVRRGFVEFSWTVNHETNRARVYTATAKALTIFEKK